MNNHCYNCKEEKPFNILKTHVYSKINEPLFIEYSFTTCTVCNSPSVFIRNNNKRAFEVVSYSRVFPKNEREIEFELPNLIKDAYIRTSKFEEMQMWSAVALCVGMVLELVCKEFVSESESNLFLNLNTMKEHGLISQEIMDWANELRVLRNIGAHVSAETILAEDAKEALDFLQAILRILYYLRPKFERMKARRTRN